MIEAKILQDLGLTELEAKIYLAALELGTDTVLKIAKLAEVKRPTAYVALDNLFAKGLVSKIQKRGTTLYSAESPNIIMNKFKEKLANFADLMPFFEAKFNRGPKPKIRYYEGVEALWDIYSKILFPSSELYFFGTDIEKIQTKFPKLMNHADIAFAKKTIKPLEIVSYNQAGIDYAKKYGQSRPIKLMPKDLPVFGDAVITENRIFIVSLDNLFGVLIESEDLAKTFKNFFLLAWTAAKDVKELKTSQNSINS